MPEIPRVWEKYPYWLRKTDFDKELIQVVTEVLAVDKGLCVFLANEVVESLTTMYNVEL